MYGIGQRLSWNGMLGTVVNVIDYKNGQGYVRLSVDERNGLPYWVEFNKVKLTLEKARDLK